MSKGLLFVVSAPSGCGKGTLLSEILKDDKFYYSVSATTRAPRPDEIDGVNYNFLSKEQFERLIESDGMLEYAKYCDNYYGTPKEAVEKKRLEGKNVILEIEVQGAMQVRKNCPDAILMFIMPPSIAELDRRLRKRGTEADDVIAKRVEKASEEIPHAEKYDYIIVNGALEKAVEDFQAIVTAEEHKSVHTKKIINEVLKNA